MAKIDMIIEKAKVATKQAGKAVKKAASWLATDEGQMLVTGLEWGVIVGAIIARRQDAKALGLTTKELVTKVKEFRKAK